MLLDLVSAARMIAIMSDSELKPPLAKAPDPLAQKPARRPLGKPADWPEEFGGPSGPEPTRYGDWERNGRVSDF